MCPNDRKVRLSLYIPILFSLSLLIVSRELFISFKDDFQTYYENYLDIINGNGFDRFGIEYGFLLLNYLLGFIFGDIAPRLLLLLYVVFQMVLLFIFFEMAIYKYKILKGPNVFVATVLITLPLLSFSVVIRQNISLIILAMSIISTSSQKKTVLVFIAASFHLSALAVFVIYLGIMKFSKFSWLFLILSGSAGFFLVSGVLPFVEGLPKIRAFFVGGVEYNLIVSIVYYKLIILCLFLNFFLKNKNAIYVRKQILLLLYFSVILDFYAPYISFRVLQIAVLFAGCLLFYHFVNFKKSANKVILYGLVLISLGLLKITSFFWINNEYSIMKSYPVYSLEAFYYVDEIFTEIKRRGRDY